MTFVNALSLIQFNHPGETALKIIREMKTGFKNSQFVRRIFVPVAGLLICGWLIWNSAEIGASRLLSHYGAATGSVEALESAISFSPGDPEAYYRLAALYLNANQSEIAAEKFGKAIRLRPRDYLLWMELGNACDQAGQTAKALSAFEQAIKFAPHYAQTHWQHGNLLLRAGRVDEAFAALRRASISQPDLTPQLIDLATGIFDGDTQTVETVVQPQTAAARMALANHFAQNGKAADAIRLFRQSRDSSNKDREALLASLLSGKNFIEAFEVWSNLRQAESPSGAIVDGSFEYEIKLDGQGFGWKIPSKIQGVEISLDSREPADGKRSLLLNWNGNPQSSSSIVSQIVLVSPRTYYQLSFRARARKLVTAGLPLVRVTDAGQSGKTLAQIVPFSEGTDGWRNLSLPFVTGDKTSAVMIIIQRQGCALPLCPIFGQTWFDHFVLQ